MWDMFATAVNISSFENNLTFIFIGYCQKKLSQKLSVWREQRLTLEFNYRGANVHTKTTDLDVCGVQVLIDTDSNVESNCFEELTLTR